MYCPEPSADNGPVNLHIERFDDIEQSIYSLEGIHKLGTYIIGSEYFPSSPQ